MLIDCDTCAVRGVACDDCVMSVILSSGGRAVELDPAEERAVGQLVEVGLVPPLRLQPGPSRRIRGIA